jgi:hypothetical protein
MLYTPYINPYLNKWWLAQISQKLETDILMFFTTFTSFAILASAISPPILSIWFWQEPKTPQTSSPWWSRLLVQRHDFGNSSHPAPGSLFGRVRPRLRWKDSAQTY